MKEKLQVGFYSRQDYNAYLQKIMNRRRITNENYTKYFYEKIVLHKRCKIFGLDTASCVIGGINDWS